MAKLLPNEQTTKNSYDKLAEQWAKQHDTSNFWNKELQTFNQLLPEGKVLEVGSGGGRDAKRLIELGYDYTGTDISSGLLEQARKALPGQKFYEQSVYDLSLPGQKFDGFWASAVLLHIPKSRIDEALQQIKNVVKSDGIGFISIKDGTGEQLETNELDGAKLERLFAYWQKGEFQEVLERNGYATLEYIFHPMSEKTKWHCFFVKV